MVIKEEHLRVLRSGTKIWMPYYNIIGYIDAIGPNFICYHNQAVVYHTWYIMGPASVYCSIKSILKKQGKLC